MRERERVCVGAVSGKTPSDSTFGLLAAALRLPAWLMCVLAL